MNGVVVIDKAPGMTSHDVVNRVRRIAQERSVGHLGTLDPMATGVLPLVLGKMTRLSQFYGESEKVYEGTIRFGFSTDTYDAEGEPASEKLPVTFSAAELRTEGANFTGEIEQTPPPYSAKKIQGVPAYKLARQKKEVELRPVKVTVHEFEILDFGEATAIFRARVSSGTYIRSLAHDLGRVVGTGAHLASLRRTQAGEFDISQAVALDALSDPSDCAAIQRHLIHPRRLLAGMPSVTANEEQMAKIRHGNAVNLPELSAAKLIKVFAGKDELAAIASRVAGTLFQPKVVLVGD